MISCFSIHVLMSWNTIPKFNNWPSHSDINRAGYFKNSYFSSRTTRIFYRLFMASVRPFSLCQATVIDQTKSGAEEIRLVRKGERESKGRKREKG